MSPANANSRHATRSRGGRPYEFDGWAVPPPDGEWNYILDDDGIVFGPGWWPFYRDRDGRREQTRVRLAPDSAYQSWRNEYVLLRPGEDASAEAHLRLFLRKQGMGGRVTHASVTIDLRERSARFDGACPAAVRKQAESKAERLLRFLLEARAERRRNAPSPATAHDRWEQDEQRQSQHPRP